MIPKKTWETHQLHGSVVNNHGVELNIRILVLGDLSGDLEEESVSHFLDVSLVDSSDLLSSVLFGELERESGDLLAFLAGNNLEN